MRSGDFDPTLRTAIQMPSRMPGEIGLDRLVYPFAPRSDTSYLLFSRDLQRSVLDPAFATRQLDYEYSWDEAETTTRIQTLRNSGRRVEVFIEHIDLVPSLIVNSPEYQIASCANDLEIPFSHVFRDGTEKVLLGGRNGRIPHSIGWPNPVWRSDIVGPLVVTHGTQEKNVVYHDLASLRLQNICGEELAPDNSSWLKFAKEVALLVVAGGNSLVAHNSTRQLDQLGYRRPNGVNFSSPPGSSVVHFYEQRASMYEWLAEELRMNEGDEPSGERSITARSQFCALIAALLKSAEQSKLFLQNPSQTMKRVGAEIGYR